MISKRARSVSPSETLQISAKAKELQRQGRSVVSLSAGEPDFKTAEHICAAAKKAIDAGFHGYTMNTGTIGLREAISDKLREDNGLEYAASQIVATNGAKQALGFSLLALVDQGDEVIIPAPYWVSYPQMVKIAGATPVIVRTSFDSNYKITPQQLEDSITGNTRAIILCSPSNPTGTCYTRQELRDLADILVRYPNISILSDEIYEYIVFDGEHAGILQAAPELYERTIVINGFSKGFAMTGWRLGYLAADQPVADAVAKIQSQETSAPSSISQKAGEAAYRGDRSAVESMRKQFHIRRNYIIQALKNIEGIRCFVPAGAFYVFPDISAYLHRTTRSGRTIDSSTALCLYLLEEHGIAAVPGDAFGEPDGIRLSYASSMDQLEEAVVRLEAGFGEIS